MLRRAEALPALPQGVIPRLPDRCTHCRLGSTCSRHRCWCSTCLACSTGRHTRFGLHMGRREHVGWMCVESSYIVCARRFEAEHLAGLARFDSAAEHYQRATIAHKTRWLTCEAAEGVVLSVVARLALLVLVAAVFTALVLALANKAPPCKSQWVAAGQLLCMCWCEARCQQSQLIK